MDKTLYLLLGAALTWAFYFVQRRVERRRTVEVIERNQKLLLLKQGLEDSHTGLDELRRFEARLIGTAQAAVRIADGFVARAEAVARQVDDDAVSGNEMNQQAVQALQRAEARLAARVGQLRAHLDGDGLAGFETAHAAWLGFRERYARFIALSYSRGPIRPLIHAVTMESITAAWNAELGTQLGADDRDERYDGPDPD